MEKIDINKLIMEYEPDDSIWREEDDIVYNYKKAISKLDNADKVIFLLYVHTQSLRETGKILGVSHTTVFKEIKIIKDKIENYVRGISN